MVTAGDHEVSGGGQAGLHSLDTLCGPLLSGQLVLIIGRPRLGKTTLILDVARRVSVCEGRPVLLFSLEHSEPAVRRRLLAAQTGLSLVHLACGSLGPDQEARIERARRLLAAAPLFIDDDPAVSVRELAERSRRVAEDQGPLGLICVDYLQLMPRDAAGAEWQGGADGAGDGQEALAVLKDLALALSVPVVVVAQLPRSGGPQRDRRSLVAGLGGRSADRVLLLRRGEMSERGTDDEGTVEITVLTEDEGPDARCREDVDQDPRGFHDCEVPRLKGEIHRSRAGRGRVGSHGLHGAVEHVSGPKTDGEPCVGVLTERQMRKTERTPEGHLLWRGGLANGRPAVKFQGRTVYLRRLLWEAAHGPIPDGLVVVCKCGERLCVEPSHLALSNPGRYPSIRDDGSLTPPGQGHQAP